MEQEFLGKTNLQLSLIRHGPHWKRRVQQFFCCCECIRYRGKVSTEPLPSNDRGIFTEQLPSNDRGDTDVNTHAHRQQRNFISLLYFFKIRKWPKKNTHQLQTFLFSTASSLAPGFFPASSPMGTEGSFPEGNAAGVWNWPLASS
jgi:hypothetical protein